MRATLKLLIGLCGMALLGAVLAQLSAVPRALAQPATTAQRTDRPNDTPNGTPRALLTRPIPDTDPNATVLRRGQYLVIASDCMSCHLRQGGEPLAGGLGLKTPFGTIYSSNITSDADTGVGSWTPEQFYRAMHDGVGAQGENLYPAFPYPWFRRLSRADTDAILAYLKTTPPVRYTPPANVLHFPFNIRATVKGWNLLNLKAKEYQPDSSQSPEWNRGAFLVSGPGHCSGCHTPKGHLGQDLTHQAFHGGDLDDWVAPDITPNAQTGLGRWSADEVSEYLKTGRNVHAGAGGAMADVVTWSTSLLTDEDRHAIAVYLGSITPSPTRSSDPVPAEVMRAGAAIYSDACASCHLENGVGQPRYFPPLGHNAMLQQTNATGVAHLILGGTRIASTPSRPSALAMPSFAWKLSDREIAAVATYIRNSWGNQAPQVPVHEVTSLRKRLALQNPRPTANSGDWE